MSEGSGTSSILFQLAAGLTEMRQAYYSVLQEDENFVSDLEQLFTRCFPEYASERIARQHRLPTRSSVVRSRTPRQQGAIAASAKKWHLPPAYRWEISTSMVAACDPEFPIRLIAADSRLLTFDREPLRITVEVRYNPRLPVPLLLRRAVNEFQARAREEIQRRRAGMTNRGWRAVPARLRDSARVRRLARRLYQRAVLGWPWRRIAEADATELDAVRKSVRDWADALGVELPVIRRGRPRKHL
jgi:hypothetical protein